MSSPRPAGLSPSKLPTEDDVRLRALHGRGGTEEGSDVNVHLRQRPELNARTDQKALLEVAPNAWSDARVHKRQLRLDADAARSLAV
jgi:hypothetical protein